MNIEVIPFARLFGGDVDTAYFLHTASQNPIILENVDAVVIASPMRRLSELVAE